MKKIRELHHQRRQTRTTSTATIRVGAGRVLCRTNESSMAPGGFPAARSLLFVPFHAHLSRSHRPVGEPFLCLSLSISVRYTTGLWIVWLCLSASAHHVIPSDGHLNSCLVNFQMPQFYEGLNYIIVVGIRRNYSKFIYEISWIDIDRNIRHHFKQHYYPKFWRDKYNHVSHKIFVFSIAK